MPLWLSVTAPRLPEPEDFVIVTVAPPLLRSLPFASLACTVSTCVLVPLAVTLALDGVKVDRAALAPPGVPVAVKVTDPLMPAAVAVSVFAPAIVPSVQLPTVATPKASVVGVSPVAEPPPEATAKVTTTPETGFPPASVTSTLGAAATAEAATALWPLPAFTLSESLLTCAVDAWSVAELAVVNEAAE